MPRPSKIAQKYPSIPALNRALATKTPTELTRELGLPPSQLYHHCDQRGWEMLTTTTREVVEIQPARAE